MTTAVIEPVARLIEAFARLPGVGPKTAQRLTFHMLRAPDAEARTLARALIAVRDEVVFCDSCFNISDAPQCPICRDPGREDARLCVVEEPLDVLAIERTGEFRGRYHVLHGAISPIDGIGPERLKIRELLARVDEAEANGERIEEVIIATNPTGGGSRGDHRHQPDARGRGDRDVPRRAAGRPRRARSRGSPAACPSAATSSTPTT